MSAGVLDFNELSFLALPHSFMYVHEYVERASLFAQCCK